MFFYNLTGDFVLSKIDKIYQKIAQNDQFFAFFEQFWENKLQPLYDNFSKFIFNLGSILVRGNETVMS